MENTWIFTHKKTGTRSRFRISEVGLAEASVLILQDSNVADYNYRLNRFPRSLKLEKFLETCALFGTNTGFGKVDCAISFVYFMF